MSSKHKTDDQIMIRFTFHGLAAIKTQRTAIKRLTAAVLTKTPNFAYGSGWEWATRRENSEFDPRFRAQFARPSLARWDIGPWGNSSSKALIVVWRAQKTNAWTGGPMSSQRKFFGNATVMSMNDELRARKVSTVQSSMWDDPKDVIEAAIRSAFVSYPKDDDRDGRMCWIAPRECSQLAIGVILGLQAPEGMPRLDQNQGMRACA
jgi:hypothetical protein